MREERQHELMSKRLADHALTRMHSCALPSVHYCSQLYTCVCTQHRAVSAHTRDLSLPPSLVSKVHRAQRFVCSEARNREAAAVRQRLAAEEEYQKSLLRRRLQATCNRLTLLRTSLSLAPRLVLCRWKLHPSGFGPRRRLNLHQCARRRRLSTQKHHWHAQRPPDWPRRSAVQRSQNSPCAFWPRPAQS
jgi:hypothetical protein